MDGRQTPISRVMFTRSSFAAAAAAASVPLSDCNVSPCRKSICFTPHKTHCDDDTPSEPRKSPLCSASVVSSGVTHSSPALPNRKPASDSPRNVRRECPSEESKSRGLWPPSKEPIPDEGRNDAVERPKVTYNASTFASRQRMSSSNRSASAPEISGRKSLHYHFGKLNVDRPLKNRGTPPSPLSSSSSSTCPPPSEEAIPCRPSSTKTALARKRPDFKADIHSPRLSWKAGARTPESPVKRRSSGVEKLLTRGLTNLFRSKSYARLHTEESPKSIPTSGIETAKTSKTIGSLGKEEVALARSIGCHASGAAAMVDSAVQHKFRTAHNHLLQWRFLNAATEVVDKIECAYAQRTLVSSWVATSDLQFLVARKRAQMSREKHGFHVANLLHHQTKTLQRWVATERQHMEAVSSTKASLLSAGFRVPLTDRAKGEPSILSILLQRATDTGAAINGNIDKCDSMAQRTAALAVALPGVVAEEEALLEECFQLLGVVYSLQVREASLRCQLIQNEKDIWQ